MKNYYHILQIETGANKQAIKAAYKRLARKYHPDVLTSDEREDPGLLEKIQEINEAYQILSDDEKRKAYDQTLKEQEEKFADAASPFERRSILVKCARTKRTYKMLLARRKNTKGKFDITGFEAMDKPLLTDSRNWLAKITETFLRKPREISKPAKDNYYFKSKFYVEDPIGIQDINWKKNISCPDCTPKPSPSDVLTTDWYVCGICKQLFYSNEYITTLTKQKILWCPWCGAKNIITSGSSKHQWRIRGQENSASKNNDQNRLSVEKPKELGDGKKK